MPSQWVFYSFLILLNNATKQKTNSDCKGEFYNSISKAKIAKCVFFIAAPVDCLKDSSNK